MNLRRVLPLSLLLSVATLTPTMCALALDAVPESFVQKVEKGWLPISCARPGNPEMPPPILRQWARVRAGERIRVLFICALQHQFEAHSIARCFDLDYDIVPIGGAANTRWAARQDSEAMNLLRHFLGTRRYDVIAMTGAWLTALPGDCATEIVELVREDGVGFVHSVPGIRPDDALANSELSPASLDALLPAARDPAIPRVKTWRVLATEAAHPLTGGSDFAGMRWVCDVDASASPDATVLLHSERADRVLAAAAIRGKGRVISLNCCLEEMIYGRPFCPPLAAPFLPEEETGKLCRWLQGTEPADQFYAWLGRALLWAARGEPAVSVRQTTVSPDCRMVKVEVANSSAEEKPCTLRVVVRSPYNTVAKASDEVRTVPAGKTEVEQLVVPGTGYAGRHLLDVFILDGEKKVWAWWCSSFEKPSKFSVSLVPDFALYTPQDEVKVKLKVAGLANGQAFTVRAELFDLEGRLLWDESNGRTAWAEGPTEVLLALNLARTGISTALANLRVTVSAAGESVEVRDQLFVRQDPRWDAFHIMAYGGYYEEPFSFAVRADVLKRMGHDTLLASWPSLHRIRTTAETGMRVLPNNIALKCGYDPEGVKYVTNWLRRFSPVLYELQDEPELQYTAASEAPFDSDRDMQRFRTFLRDKYGTIEALNAAWGTEAAARRAGGPNSQVVSVLPAEARFKLDPNDEGVKRQWFAADLDDSSWDKIRTGESWEQQGYDYDGYAWYRLEFAIPAEARGRKLSLAFGGADEEAWVYLNGKPLGERSVASTGRPPEELWDKSFDMRLPDELKPGLANTLAVRVHDRGAAGGLYQPIKLMAEGEKASTPARGNGYTDWNQVQRFLWYEVVESDNWTPWFDSRRELDQFFLEKFGACSDAIREVEPDRLASVNYRGVETFSGVNLRAFTRRLQASSLYTDFIRDRESAASISFLELGSRWATLTMSVVGYTSPPLTELQGQRITHEAWNAVRHGVNMIAWFYPPDYLNTDYTLNEEGRVIEKLNRLLLAGPGQVAAVTQPLREGIFVYCPRTLFYTHTLAHMKRQLAGTPGGKPTEIKGLGPFQNQVPNSFVPHLRALGYQFEFGDEDDLTRQRLKRTRVVLLSHVVCLGARELELLHEFVKSGGCVVAEAGTGRRDASGRLYARTPQTFRRLFGVQRPTPNLSPAVEADGVVPAGARKMDWIPPTLGAGYRNGKAFFLDFAVPASAEGYQVIKRTLESAGIRPTYALRDNRVPASPAVMVDLYGVSFSITNGLIASLVVRQLGNLTYLYLTGDRPGAPGRFSIALPRKQYVYEMVSDKELGMLHTIEGTIAYGEARVFGLSPSPVLAFTAQAGGQQCHPGDKLQVRFNLSTGNGDAGDRVVRLEYRGPGEGNRPALPRTLILRGGRGELSTVLPLNCMPGTVWIRAKDLTSGKQCQAAIEVVLPSR